MAMESSPPSASHSENSATTHSTPPPPPPPPPMAPKLDDANDNGLPNVIDENHIFFYFQILDSLEYMDTYKKHEADYTRRLIAKYFSKKNFYGGNIFDEKITIDDETIMSSRWPCTQSFADPLRGLEEQSGHGSTSTSEA